MRHCVRLVAPAVTEENIACTQPSVELLTAVGCKAKILAVAAQVAPSSKEIDTDKSST